MKYTRIEFKDCLNYKEMLEEYEKNLKKDYKLVGYEHDSIEQKGVLVLYPRRKEK